MNIIGYPLHNGMFAATEVIMVLFALADETYFFDPFSMHFLASPATPLPMITDQDCARPYVSSLLHEITHLDCMRSDLGLGLLLNMFQIKNFFEKTGLTLDGKTTTDAKRTRLRMRMREITADTQLPLVLAFFAPIPVLEGLAMFAQLDMTLSCNEVSSLHFRAVLSLLLQSHKLPQTSLSEMLSVVYRHHEAVRLHTRIKARLLRTLLFDVSVHNSYYLFGYIFVKSLALILREKDHRFSNTEMAYLFLKPLLLNGTDYIRNSLKWTDVNTLLRSRFEILRDCPSERIRLAYGVLSDDTDDVCSCIDWAHFLVTGELRSATEDAALRSALDAAQLKNDELDELISFWRSMEFIPLKIVTTWIAGAVSYGDDVQLSLVSGNAEQSVHAVRWLTKAWFQSIEEDSQSDGKFVQIRNEIDIAKAFDVIGDPCRPSLLFATGFYAEHPSTPITLWCSRSAVFSEAGERLNRLDAPQCAYLNYSRRRKFAEFIFDVIGRVPSPGVPIHEFCSFIFRELMYIRGAKQFRRFREHGFSILPITDDVSTEQDLSLATRKELNGILRYQIF